MKGYKLLLALLLLFIGIYSCKKTTKKLAITMQQRSFSNYESNWNEVEKMEKKGLGKEIISKVDSILNKAQIEENTPQIFKALAYRSKFINQIEEESTFKILSQFESQIKESKFPLKQLLHSATSEMYLQYYQLNRWQFKNRTETTNFNLEDFRTWSLQDILNKVDHHYQASLTQKADQLSYPIENLKEIIVQPTFANKQNYLNGVAVQPSLYDFIAHRAINYYKKNEGRVSTPQVEFKLVEFPVFSPAEEFIQLNFQITDSNSNNLKTALLFQELLSGRINAKNHGAFIALDLERLRHYYSISTKDNKDSLYLKALTQLSAKFATSEHRAEIEYERAKFYYENGARYSPSIHLEKRRWFLKKAHSICSTYAYESTFGGIQCSGLIQNIEEKEIRIEVEKVFLPSEKIAYTVNSKNTDSLFFEIYSVPNTKSSGRDRNENNQNYIKRLRKNTAIKSWSKKLENPKDFHPHSYLFSLEKLPLGKYVLISSSLKSFSTQNGYINYNSFTVSNLSFIKETENNQAGFNFYALNRENGKAIENVTVQCYTNKYDYNKRENNFQLLTEGNTDKNGFLKTSVTKSRGFQVVIFKGKDTLVSDNNFYGRNYDRGSKTSVRTHFFTDRAIYRPGQTIYFKGIVIEEGHNQHEVKPNYSSEVFLYNKNREKLTSLKVKTNDYGSFKGSFVLPSGGLNGNFSISTKNGATNFSVEEYKRPTFEVTIDSSNATPKINSAVTVIGNVLGFSGAKVSNATINYRIIRRTYLPYGSYWRRPFNNNDVKEIVNGKLESNDNGKFTIDFFAEAIKTAKEQSNTNYNFEITIDATTPSGETQSLTQNIKLGAFPFYLSTNLSESIQLNELQKLIVYSKNIEETEVEKKVKLKVYRLKAPKKAKKTAYWDNIEYKENKLAEKDRSELKDFERGEELLSGLIATNVKTDLIGQLPIGAYEIEVEATKEIKLTERFILFDENATQLAIPSFSYFKELTNEVEPGENAEFLIGSSLANVRLLYEIEVDNKKIESKWITLNKEQRKISIPIKESYRGDFSVSFIGVQSNRVISKNFTVKVPYTNKKLKLELGTYRNKVQPGSKEKWTMSISGLNGEKLAAELLAGMYDQSLDQFKTDNWNLNLYQPSYGKNTWQSDGTFTLSHSNYFGGDNGYVQEVRRQFPSLNWFGFNLGYQTRFDKSISYSMSSRQKSRVPQAEMMESEVQMDAVAIKTGGMPASFGDVSEDNDFSKKISPPSAFTNSEIKLLRTDFRETAFFYPQLSTDKNGKISFEFEMPDALTKWKFRALAHTKDLKVGTTETTIQTQKELMVSPTFPRFFREGDELNLKVLLSNLSKKPQNGTAKIRFYDAFTNAPIDISDGNSADNKFSILGGRNSTATWKVKIPMGIQAIKYKVTAQSESFSDGEEKVIPVLSNRMLVTETMPLTVRGNETKNFSFDKLQNNSSKTLVNHSFSLEFTANPAWYAVQALPYVIEGTSECSEQIFARLYANLLAEKIANSNPRIQEIVSLWKGQNSKELTSKLLQNQELKSILIEETPWLQQAKSETEQKERIALLFDLNKMATEKAAALQKLKQLQLPNGGWSWYKGMRDNRYITQYIINGFGHLKQLGINLSADQEMAAVITKGLTYLDDRAIEDYENLKKNKRDLEKDNLGSSQIHYIYTRSFFLDVPFTKEKTAFNYYLKQADKYWVSKSLQLKGMLALSLNRYKKESNTPKQIVAALKDNALQTDNLGMYWKENQSGYYWHNSVIETQALMVEVFQEVAKDKAAVDELRIWLLKQKQTQIWPNSKATALACYALLIDNQTALATENKVEVVAGKKLIIPTKTEAGTGYFKEVWLKKEVKPTLGEITVSKKSDGVAWGAAYWQYYEDLDQITTAKNEEFSMVKTLFKVNVTEQGEKMAPIDVNAIKIGDKIRVRLRIESKINLEFVHLKDMRASGFEPINVISRYKFQDGIGYYESTKDASTNFFMDRLNKGVYVFEYDLRATVAGEFSNGISTLQCQYAPEFATHSKGRRVVIGE